jgi:predicted lipid carrier protein YhbT
MTTSPLLIETAKRLPMPVLQAVAEATLIRVLASHPGLAGRLGAHSTKRFAFVVPELDLAFRIDPSKRRVTASRINGLPRTGMKAAHATATGSLPALMALLEGRAEGDLVSPDFAVCGDRAAMTALRDALRSDPIELPKEFGRSLGPLAPLAERLGSSLRRRLMSA